MKKKDWIEFITVFKSKLQEIIDPAVKSGAYTSSETMEDIITNIILFTMNLDKKPWDKIPKRKVHFCLNRKEAREDILMIMKTEELASVLRDKLDSETSYYDDTLANATPRHNLKCALWIALDNLLKNNDEF